MHELGVVYEVVRQVTDIAQKQRLKEVASITLQIGQISSIVPEYVEKCFPAAVDGTMMEHTELHIEILPANGMCKGCGKVFNVVDNKKICPGCGSNQWDLLSGQGFFIKEIQAC
ncbi:MAG: hydrogenase maturation nickel metallochaperone HypA [Clostridia bacterium]